MADPKVPSYLPITPSEKTGSVANKPGGGLAESWGVDMSGYVPAGGAGKKAGTYVNTSVSNKIPDDIAIKDNINKVFQRFYKRDANQNELAIWLPSLKEKYKGKNGQDKTTTKQTYDANGNLVSTVYLTADGMDPSLWLEGKIKDQLVSGKQEVSKIGVPEGPSGTYFLGVKQFAANNGIMLSDNVAKDYANKIVAGVVDETTVLNTIRDSAAQAFPSLADKIKQGIDLKNLADPYIQSMSRILEIPDSGIDLFDPSIRNAMAYTLPDGKVGTKSIYDFERDLRKDTRWQYTNNAREEVSNSTQKVLKDFGFMG